MKPQYLLTWILIIGMLFACAPATEIPAIQATPTVDLFSPATNSTASAPNEVIPSLGPDWTRYVIGEGYLFEFNLGETLEDMGTNHCLIIQQTDDLDKVKIYLVTTEVRPIFGEYGSSVTYFDKKCPIGTVAEIATIAQTINSDLFANEAVLVFITMREQELDCTTWACNPMLSNLNYNLRGAEGLDSYSTNAVFTNNFNEAMNQSAPAVVLVSCYKAGTNEVDEQFIVIKAPNTKMSNPCGQKQFSANGNMYHPQGYYSESGLKIALTQKALDVLDNLPNRLETGCFTSYESIPGCVHTRSD